MLSICEVDIRSNHPRRLRWRHFASLSLSSWSRDDTPDMSLRQGNLPKKLYAARQAEVDSLSRKKGGESKGQKSCKAVVILVGEFRCKVNISLGKAIFGAFV